MSRFTRETNRRSPQSCSARVTRRKLLKTAVAAGAGAIAMPLVLPSRLFGADAPSKRLNVAAVGTGGRCRALMTEILRQGENLVALCDVDQRQFASAAQGPRRDKSRAATRPWRRPGSTTITGSCWTRRNRSMRW